MFKGICDLLVAIRKFKGSFLEFAGLAKGGSKMPNAKAASRWKPPK